MIDELISGISTAIDDHYEGAYPIRTEPIEQQKGGAIDRFFIRPINAVPINYMRDRGRYRCTFDVRFHPGDNSTTLLGGLQWTVLELLRMIKPPGMAPRKAYNMTCDIVDSVVHVIVDYDVWVNAKEEKILVQKLYQYKGVKRDAD